MLDSSLKPGLIFSFLAGLFLFSGCTTIEENTAKKPKPDEILAGKRALIVGHLNRGQPERAIKELRPLVRKHNNNSDLLGLLGLSYLAINNPKKAIQPLRRAHSLKPTATTALNLSSAYIESRRLGKAKRLLHSIRTDESMYQKYSYPERITHNLGLISEKQRKFKSAIKYYREALDENPGFYLSLMQLASLQERLGRRRKAVSRYKQARRLCAKCLAPVEKLSQTFMRSGKPKKAQSLLKAYVTRRDIDAASRDKAKSLLLLANRSLETTNRGVRAARSRGTSGARKAVRIE